MKKRIFCLLLIALLLSACGGRQELPADWDENWTVVCPVLAVEPLDGFALHESNDALYLSGIYYATWITGDARSHTNEEGEEADIFDGQIYVIMQEYKSADSAKSGIAQWTAREKQTYETGEEASITCSGQEYTLLPLLNGSATNPYSRGAAAFAVRGNWAICVEFLGAQSYEADMTQILELFLNGFHFSE